MKDYAQVFQGDVWLMKLPDTMKIAQEAEIAPHAGKLILQEGEMTGHHHYVDTVMDRVGTGPNPIFGGGKFISEEDFVEEDVSFSALDTAFGGKLAQKQDVPQAKMFSATKLAEQLVKENILMRADLVVGLLEVSNGPMNLFHQEHGSIALAPGKYCFGRQIESVAGEERRVAD